MICGAKRDRATGQTDVRTSYSGHVEARTHVGTTICARFRRERHSARTRTCGTLCAWIVQLTEGRSHVLLVGTLRLGVKVRSFHRANYDNWLGKVRRDQNQSISRLWGEARQRHGTNRCALVVSKHAEERTHAGATVCPRWWRGHRCREMPRDM